MSKENVMFLLMIGIGIASTLSLSLAQSGLSGEKRSNKSSKYYESVFYLITGIMAGILTILLVFYVFNFIGSISKNLFFLLMMVWAIISLFISGMYGILNKEKINNILLASFSKQSVTYSIIFAIAMVIILLRPHHF